MLEFKAYIYNFPTVKLRISLEAENHFISEKGVLQKKFGNHWFK